ncbi:hypothetical protein KKA14_01690, partial [bacterium]|nr:hypothetical protein [bacterium]
MNTTNNNNNNIFNVLIMRIKALFDPIDRVIVQAKSYIYEQDIRKQNIAVIENKVEEIKPELEKRRSELNSLIQQIDPEDDFKEELVKSIQQIESYIDHIELIAEKELALEILEHEEDENDDVKKELREKYVRLQVGRLEDQLRNTDSFFEVADFANEIWADFDLFEEFSRDETVVQLLVDRMNETNAKNTETRMGRDLRKTLEHIRLNLVKSSAWSDQDVKEYQAERDLKLKQLKPVKIPDNRSFGVIMLGGGPEVVQKLYDVYALPNKLSLQWEDIEKLDVIENLINSAKQDLVIFYSMFPKHKKFMKVKEMLAEKAISYIDVISFKTPKLLKVIEDELIQI